MTGITRQNIFKLKRSNVSGKMPTTSDLLVGELAVNTQDGFLYSSIANTGGTNTIEVRQIGWDRLSTISGGTINGDVIVNGSLSATTYLGLPLDVYVTGGTYSNGTLTLNRQNGSTSVSNFFTGFTLSDGTNTQSISNGDVLLVSVGSGLTSTVSATDRVTINLNITGTTAEASPANGDKLLIFDASSGTHRNIDWSQLPAVTLKVTNITSSATPSIYYDVDQYNITDLATNITSVSLSGTFVDRQRLIVTIKDNGTARTIMWGSSFNGTWATLPTTTVVGKTWIGGFIYNATTSKYECVASFFSL